MHTLTFILRKKDMKQYRVQNTKNDIKYMYVEVLYGKKEYPDFDYY